MIARDNPLATWRVEQVKYRLPGLTWDQLLSRFESLGRRGALIGPHGSGKTTLLEEFASRWQDRGFSVHRFRLTAGQPHFSPQAARLLRAGFGDRDIVLLDGAEQLSFWRWWQFRRATRSAHGVLITAHQAKRLPTLLECRTSPELLTGLVAELLPDPSLRPTPTRCRELFQRHQGNLREALRELYDVLAAR